MTIRKTKLVVAVCLLGVCAVSCTKKKTDKPPQQEPPQQGNTTPPQPSPTEKAVEPGPVVDRAIKVSGGLEALKAKLSAYTVRSRGKFYGQPYTAVTHWKAPDRLVMVIENAMAMGYVGKECWNRYHDVVVDCYPTEAKGAPEMLAFTRAMTLYPLKDPGTKLEGAGTVQVKGKDADGVKVTLPGAPMPVTIYFYKDTGLPAKATYKGHWMGKPATIETEMWAYQDFGGVKMASRSLMFVDRRVIIDETCFKVETGKADESAFNRPPQGKPGVPKLRAVPVQTVAFTTHKGAYDKDKLGASIGRLMGWIVRSRMDIMGGPAMIFLKGPAQTKNPAEFVTEIRVPVVPSGGPPPKAPNFGVKTVPAHTIAVQIALGPYDKAASGYKKLAGWIAKNKRKIIGPAGMVGFNDPNKVAKEKIVSEIFFPVDGPPPVKEGAKPDAGAKDKPAATPPDKAGGKPAGKAGDKAGLKPGKRRARRRTVRRARPE